MRSSAEMERETGRFKKEDRDSERNELGGGTSRENSLNRSLSHAGSLIMDTSNHMRDQRQWERTLIPN